MKKILIILLLLGTMGATAYAARRATVYRDQAFRADSVAAANDTARALVLATLDSSTTAWALRIVQTELERDSLDRELDARPVIRVAAGIRVDTLRMTDTVDAIQEDTVEVYAFTGSDGPFSFRGDARLFPDRAGIFRVAVAMTEPVPVHVRVTCGREAGVRSASVLLTADHPFSVVPASVEQAPHICNPAPGFQWLPELSLKGLGWELGKGLAWVLLWELADGLLDGEDDGQRY